MDRGATRGHGLRVNGRSPKSLRQRNRAKQKDNRKLLSGPVPGSGSHGGSGIRSCARRCMWLAVACAHTDNTQQQFALQQSGWPQEEAEQEKAGGDVAGGRVRVQSTMKRVHVFSFHRRFTRRAICASAGAAICHWRALLLQDVIDVLCLNQRLRGRMSLAGFACAGCSGGSACRASAGTVTVVAVVVVVVVAVVVLVVVVVEAIIIVAATVVVKVPAAHALA